MGQSRGLSLRLLINRRRNQQRGKFLDKERRAVTKREARPSRVKEQKNWSQKNKTEGGNFRKKEKNRDWGVTAQRRRTVPHHLGTTAVLPLHRHNSTVIPPPSTLPTPAEPEREKRNRTETEDNAEKGRRTTVQAASPVPQLPPALLAVSSTATAERGGRCWQRQQTLGRRKNRSSCRRASPPPLWSTANRREATHPLQRGKKACWQRERKTEEETSTAKQRGEEERPPLQPPSATTAATAGTTLPFTPARTPPSQVSLPPPFFFFFFFFFSLYFPAVHCMNSRREL